MGLRRTQCLKDYTLTKQGVKLGCGTGQEKGMGGRGNKRRAERGREQNQDGARGAEASFYRRKPPPRRGRFVTHRLHFTRSLGPNATVPRLWCDG